MLRRSILGPGSLLSFCSIVSLCLQLSAAAVQATDMQFDGIDAPVDIVANNQPVTVSFRVSNVGPQTANTIQCNVEIINLDLDQPMYNAVVEAANIDPAMQLSLNASTPFIPDLAGNYLIQVDIQFADEINPANNLGFSEFVVQDQMLTLAEAIAILDEEVVTGHPLIDEIDVWHIRPPAAMSDSLIAPGTAIEPLDGAFTLRYEYPVYLFFIDEQPDQFFAHACQFVTVSAVDGNLEAHQAETWPFIADESAVFGDICNKNNPNRLRGRAVNCATKENPYQAKTTGNKTDWALVVVGRLRLDAEKKAVDKDICKYKERINGGSLGPGITGDNINVQSGTNGTGLTVKEFCDALASYKGKKCRKFHLKYIGHGLKSGLIFKSADGKGRQVLSHKEIACKLKEAGIGEAVIEVTACHSGAIIKQLEKKKIKGIVITSSNSANTTPVGDGNGTFWEEALLQCSKSELADLNRDSTVDHCELIAWVLTQNAKASKPKPQLKKMNDSVRSVRIRVDRIGRRYTIPTNAGGLWVYAQRICLRSKVKGSDGKRRTITSYRAAVYIENPGKRRRTANTSFRITARCKGGTRVLVERIRPNLGPGEKVCITEMPADCRSIRVRRLRNPAGKRERGPDVIQADPEDQGVEERITYAAVQQAGEVFLHRHIFVSSSATLRYETMTDGPAAWELRSDPASFAVPANDSADIFISGAIPASAEEGGLVETMIIDPAAQDTTILEYRILLPDSLPSADEAFDPKNYRLIEGRGDWRIDKALPLISNSFIAVRDSLRIEAVAGGALDLRQTAINADSGQSLAMHISGGVQRLHDLALRGLSSPLRIDGADTLELRNLLIGNSTGDALHLGGDFAARPQLDFIEISAGGGNGLVIDDYGPFDTLLIRGLQISLVDSSDIVLHGNGHLKCIDCSYDDSRAWGDADATIRRYATLSVAVVDTTDQGVADAEITVVNGLGQEVFSGRTDEQGFVVDQLLLLSSTVGRDVERFGEFIVTMRLGRDIQIDTIAPEAYRQIVFVTKGRATSISEKEAETGLAPRILALYPQPLQSGNSLSWQVESPRIAELAATVYTLLGERVARSSQALHVSGVSTMSMPLPVLPSGIYLLELSGADGSILRQSFVVR